MPVTPVTVILLPGWALSPTADTVTPPQLALAPVEGGDGWSAGEWVEAVKPPAPCALCGSLELWWNLLGGIHCMRCHPPVVSSRLLRLRSTCCRTRLATTPRRTTERVTVGSPGVAEAGGRSPATSDSRPSGRGEKTRAVDWQSACHGQRASDCERTTDYGAMIYD